MWEQLTQGTKGLVEGRLQIRSYDDKDGNRHWVTEVIADRVEFIEERVRVPGSFFSRQHAFPERKCPEPRGMESFGSPMGFDEEIPF